MNAGGIRALYFAYFTYVGLFSPYLSLYLAALGLTIAQIGVLMAVPQVLRIVGPPFWGWLADRGGSRVLLLRVSSVGACLSTLLLPLAGGHFAALLPVLALLFFMTAAQMPIGEAMAMQLAGGDAGRYGRLRVWGSVGFIAGVVAMGPVLDAWGMHSLPWWMAAILAALAASAWMMRVIPLPAGAPPTLRVRERLREPRVQAFFASAFLMIFAHAGLYAFLSLYLAQLGYSKTAIGLLWALGVVAEIGIFWAQRGLFERFGAIRLLDASLWVAVLRFALIGLSAHWLPALVLAQLLHAVTFGIHHSATVAMLQRWFEPGQQARAQALYMMIGYGLGGALGVLVASQVWTAVSPAAVFLVSSGAAVLAGAAFRRCRAPAAVCP
ncbi:MAG: MFS transporter [Burkholderiaceae bacterium]|nr:MFS transporter [Burkholderiaceae bacterium]